jgi:ribonuclease P/MRP protein subunit RPP1
VSIVEESMKKFIDLHLRPVSKLEKDSMIILAQKLGFSSIALSTFKTPSLKNQNLIEIISRVDLCPKNQRDLISSLKKVRRHYEIVCVECYTKSVARQAARDNRVDILNFPISLSSRLKVGFDRQEASLASRSNCTYEINISDIITQTSFTLSKFISLLRSEVDHAWRNDVPILVSSGAKTLWQLRDPRALTAFMSLIDTEIPNMELISQTPIKLIETNREKLGPDFLFPGMKVAK